MMTGWRALRRLLERPRCNDSSRRRRRRATSGARSARCESSAALTLFVLAVLLSSIWPVSFLPSESCSTRAPSFDGCQCAVCFFFCARSLLVHSLDVVPCSDPPMGFGAVAAPAPSRCQSSGGGSGRDTPTAGSRSRGARRFPEWHWKNSRVDELAGRVPQLSVDLQCCTGRRCTESSPRRYRCRLLFGFNVMNAVYSARWQSHSGDPWHWKNSQSALRQVVGSLVPEIAPGNQFVNAQPAATTRCRIALPRLSVSRVMRHDGRPRESDQRGR